MNITELALSIAGQDCRSLQVVSAECVDGIGVVPQLSIELSVDNSLQAWFLGDFSGLRGAAAQLQATSADGSSRSYCGVIEHVSAQLGLQGQVHRLRLTLVAWPRHQPTLLKGYRFFQDQTAVTMAEAVFKGDDACLATSYAGTPPPVRAYSVQYAESDRDFASRVLLEDKVLFQIAVHASESPPAFAATLRMFSGIDSLPAADELLKFSPLRAQSPGATEGIYDVEVDYQRAPDVVALAAYLQPNLDGRVTTTLDTPNAAQWVEVETQAAYLDLPQGQRWADRQLQARRAPRYRFKSSHLWLEVGKLYRTEGLGAGSADSLAVVSSRQTFRRLDLGGWSLEGEFLAVSASDTYEPAPPPAPVLPGLVYGVAVGEDVGQLRSTTAKLQPAYGKFGSDEVVDADALGRIRVRIYWNAEARAADTPAPDTVWLRLMTPWAGQQAGFFALPRIGQELIVSFIHGDPRQPVVLGCLYAQTEDNPSLPTWDPATDKQWVGIGTRSQDGLRQYLRLDASPPGEDNQGVELSSASRLHMNAAQTVNMTAPYIFIGNKLRTNTLEMSAKDVTTKSENVKTDEDWKKSIFLGSYSAGLMTFDNTAIKGSIYGSQNTAGLLSVGVTGMTVNATGFAVGATLGKVDGTVLTIKNSPFEIAIKGLDFSGKAAKSDNTLADNKNSGVKANADGVKGDGQGVSGQTSVSKLSVSAMDSRANMLTVIV